MLLIPAFISSSFALYLFIDQGAKGRLIENISEYIVSVFGSSIERSLLDVKINQADVLTLQSEIASNETQLLILEKQKEVEIYKINKLLGRNLDSKDVFAVQDFSTEILLSSQSKLEELLGYSNPSLKKMDRMIEMKNAMIEANNRELIPDLMVQEMFMRMPRGMILFV